MTHVNSQFEDKFIAFIDVLGFKNLVERAEAGDGITIQQLAEIQNKLGSPKNREQLSKCGPIICPQSAFRSKDLDLRLTQMSDSSLLSTEVSPAGVINLVHLCWSMVVDLLYMGLLCRGYITRGSILHTEERFIGSGFHAALKNEKNVRFKAEEGDTGTPYVEVNPGVTSYIDESGDACLKEMFSRMVERFDGTVALFPFKRLSHSFIVGGFGVKFDSNHEKVSNDSIRTELHRLRARVMSFANAGDERAVRKTKHYISAIERQLRACDSTDQMIDAFLQPLPRGDGRR